MLRKSGPALIASFALLVMVVLTACGQQAPAATPAAAKPAATTAPAGAPAGGQSASPAAKAGAIDPSKEPYKIGAIITVTASAIDPIGANEKLSIQMAADEINAQGGINGHKLDVIIYDDEAQQDKALNLVRKLITDDKVLGVIGASLTGSSQVMAPELERAGVTMLMPTPTYSIAQDRKFVFLTTPRNEIDAGAILSYVKNTMKKTKIAVLHDQNPFGSEVAGTVEKLAKDPYQLNMVVKVAYNNASPDLTAEVLQARSAGAEVITTWGTNPGPARIAIAARNMGWDVPILSSTGAASPALVQLGGKAVEAQIFTTVFSSSDPDPQDAHFVSAFKEKYNKNPDNFSAYTYDSVYLFKLALEKAGADRAKIRDAVENTKGYKGVTGTFNFSATDKNGLVIEDIVLQQVKDGQWVKVKK